jgi:hypothetical protein
VRGVELAHARKEERVDRSKMIRLFEAHREAEAARDIDAILESFVEECFL